MKCLPRPPRPHRAKTRRPKARRNAHGTPEQRKKRRKRQRDALGDIASSALLLFGVPLLLNLLDRWGISIPPLEPRKPQTPKAKRIGREDPRDVVIDVKPEAIK